MGTLTWMAPELFALKPKHSASSDMYLCLQFRYENFIIENNRYAFAMIMWEVGSLTIPYEGAMPDVIKDLITAGERAEDIENCPLGYMRLIHRCWDQCPQNRPSIDEIILEIEIIKQQVINDSK